MSKIHEVRCDKCKTKALLTFNGEHWLVPVDWVELYDDNKAQNLDEHLCPKCRPSTKKKVK